jgi:hypothetical protein
MKKKKNFNTSNGGTSSAGSTVDIKSELLTFITEAEIESIKSDLGLLYAMKCEFEGEQPDYKRFRDQVFFLEVVRSLVF